MEFFPRRRIQYFRSTKSEFTQLKNLIKSPAFDSAFVTRAFLWNRKMPEQRETRRKRTINWILWQKHYVCGPKNLCRSTKKIIHHTSEKRLSTKKCQKKRRLLIKRNPIYVSTHKHTQPFQRDGQAFNQRTDESEGEKLEIRFNKLMWGWHE